MIANAKGSHCFKFFGTLLNIACRWLGAMADELPAITGVYEVCLGVASREELEETVRHYQQFGFGEPCHEGLLSPDVAEALYGHRSKAACVRLPHLDSDHGLLRIMCWSTPRNEGVGVGPLKAVGSRWATALTADIFNVAHHAREAQAFEGVQRIEADFRSGLKKTWSESSYFVEPVLDVIYKPKEVEPPFVGMKPHVHEMLLSRKVTGKQVFFSRADYSLPYYGQINDDAHFPSSQFTHVGIVLAGDVDVLDFYEKTLGLLRTRDDMSSFTIGTQAMFDTREEDGEVMYTIGLDDPRSSTDMSKYRSGRLYAKVLQPGTTVKSNVTELSSPGSLGMSLYSYRVKDLEGYRSRLLGSAATTVSEIIPNEFGELSLTFVAPDGYWWQLIERLG